MAVMLVGSTALVAEDAFADKKRHDDKKKGGYEKSHAVAQMNYCGNGEEPLNVWCQNTASQIQGDENVAALASQQSFPGEEVVPPDEVGCPEDTVWDITIVEEGDPGEPTTLPVGTVICLIQGLGEQDAFIILSSGARARIV